MGWKHESKVKGFWALRWNPQENDDAIKRNGDIKERHSPGQDIGVGFGHAT